MWKPFYYKNQLTNYSCSENGQVKNNTTNKILKGRINKQGYKQFSIYINKNKITMLCHRMIATTCLDNPNQYSVVNHLDENKLNNNICNLEWTSYSNNNQHAWDNKLNSAKNFSKPVEQYDLNMNLIQVFPSCAEAVKKTGACKVHDVACGKRKTSGGFIWRFVEDVPIKDTGLSKAVNQYDRDGNYIDTFSSISEASRMTKVSRKGINDCCLHKLHLSGGYIWKFV